MLDAICRGAERDPFALEINLHCIARPGVADGTSDQRDAIPVDAEARAFALDHAPGELVRRADKGGDKPRGWRIVDIQLRSDLLQHALVHHRHAVAHGERLFLVVRHVDEGDTELLLVATYLDFHLLAQLAVEVGQRLVEQQKLGPRNQSPRERDALLLAT